MSEETNEGTITCPFCAEDIKAQAVICKHCGSKLGGSTESTSSSQMPSQADANEQTADARIGLSITALILGALTIAWGLTDIGLVADGDYAYIADEEIGFLAILGIPALVMGIVAFRRKQRLGTASLVVGIAAVLVVFSAAAYTL